MGKCLIVCLNKKKMGQVQLYWFKYEIGSLLVYILYVHSKKVAFFQCKIKNHFGLNT